MCKARCHNGLFVLLVRCHYINTNKSAYCGLVMGQLQVFNKLRVSTACSGLWFWRYGDI